MRKFADLEKSDTGNWNVAQYFVIMKIMKLLAELDILEVRARYGSNSTEEEFMMGFSDITRVRVNSIKRLPDTLRMLIGNTLFAIRRSDKKEFMMYHDMVLELKTLVPSTYEVIKDVRNNRDKIIINETNFDKVLDGLVYVKDKILLPMNKADLIFTAQEEFNPTEYKKKRITEFIETG